MAKIKAPFVGWRGRRFYFVTKTYKTTLEGPKNKVEATLRKVLPAWREAAEKKGEDDIVVLIDKQIAILGPA